MIKTLILSITLTLPTVAAVADWPMFRGNSLATGVATATLPDNLALLWKFEVKQGAFEGTAAIEGDVVFIGDLDGTVYALDLNSGAKKWEHKTDAGFIASPAVREGLVYIGDYDEPQAMLTWPSRSARGCRPSVST